MVEATPLLQGSAPRGRRVARAQVAVGLLGLLVGALLVMSLRSGGVRRVALGETNDYNSWIGSLGSDDETKEFQLDMKTSAAVQSDYTDPAQEVPEQLAKFKRAVSLEREKYKALKEIVDENEADKPEALVVRVAERGEVGPKGPRGVRGVQGDEGDPGPKGPPGPPGDLGPRGDRGPIGPTGPKGNPGDKGKRGFEGRVGKRGPQGPEGGGGNKGDTGPPGDRGPPGPQGGNGRVGDEGPDGATGDEGEAGTSRFKVIMATIG